MGVAIIAKWGTVFWSVRKFSLYRGEYADEKDIIV